MKKSLLLFGSLFLLAFTFYSFAQESSVQGGPEITFEKEVHDYGTVQQNGNGECEFVFTNTGNEPLIISKAQGSCGCTVPQWPSEPIKLGESAVIKVKYDTKRVGPINKQVTITSNAVNEPTKIIRIRGTVVAAPTAPIKSPEGPTAQ